MMMPMFARVPGARPSGYFDASLIREVLEMRCGGVLGLKVCPLGIDAPGVAQVLAGGRSHR